MARTFKADVRFRFAPTALSLLPAAFFAALAFAYSAYTTWKAKSRKRARGRRDW
jgi:NO-binding membrane sensor protein with MHYT domain